MPVKVYYYIKDKEGFALEDRIYESITGEDDLFLWQHINNARKEAKVTRERFCLIKTSCSPDKRPTWINPNWPVVPFPKLKRARLAFGRYVVDKPPKPVDPEYDQPK